MLSQENKDSNILNVKVKNYVECGWCNDTEKKVILKIPWNIWSQWMYISRQMGDKEWGAAFWVKDNTISKFKIPKQEVDSTECQFKEEIGGDGIVHSHHNMGAFHSSQDNHHARNLYSYSIVISNTDGYEATKRVKLPCGGFGYAKVELHLAGCPNIDLSKITERKQESILGMHTEKDQRRLGFEDSEFACNKCVTHNCDTCEILNSAHIPCYMCESFKCKTCKFNIGRDFREVLPFCDFCEDYGDCRSCPKLKKYLDNYPEEREHAGYLYANELPE